MKKMGLFNVKSILLNGKKNFARLLTIFISVQVEHQISDLVVDRAHYDSGQRRKEKEKCQVGKLLNVMPKRLGLVLIYYSFFSVSVDVIHSFHFKDAAGSGLYSHPYYYRKVICLKMGHFIYKASIRQ